MKEINNLIYSLEINIVTTSSANSSISVRFNDDCLKIKTIKVGDVTVTEETINERVLSGRLDDSSKHCGYRYDYQNGENLLNINPNIPIDTAISLINKSKKKPGFLTTELVLSSILRNDYRVVILTEGNIEIIKTVSAKNENSEQCSVQETINLSKSKSDESFVETAKKRIYTIDDRMVEETQTSNDIKIKPLLRKLLDILNKQPKNCKELIETKKQIQQNHIINEGKLL